jgi:hypothetical protein
VALVAAWAGYPPSASAQGTLRATVTNVPPVLSSPFVADIEQNIRQGRYGVQLTYAAPGGAPVTARLRLTVRHEGTRVLETTSQPASFEPGTYLYRTFDERPRLAFPASAQDLIDQLTGRLREQVIRGGVLPEGEYTIEATPVLADPAAAVSPIAGTAVTTVRYPEPPELVSPADRQAVTTERPVFSWTPVNAAGGDVFAYELLIAKVLPNQTPVQAIEANRLVTGPEPVELRQRTSFPYTAERPPLEAGARYAWQVRARETTQGVPLSDEGESAIHTFTYQPRPALSYTGPTLIAPEGEKSVPGWKSLQFEWQAPKGPGAEETDRYRRFAQRIRIVPQEEGQSAQAALEQNEALAETTVAFEPGQRQTSAYPSDAPTPQDGPYVWGVQLMGETSDGTIETVTASSAAAFSIGAEEPPPIAGSGVIELTRFAALVGTDNLGQTDGRYSGQAQMALALIGQDQPVRVPAQVDKLKAAPNDAQPAGAAVDAAGADSGSRRKDAPLGRSGRCDQGRGAFEA